MSVFCETWATDTQFTPGAHTALYLLKGTAHQNGTNWSDSSGFFVAVGEHVITATQVQLIRFCIGTTDFNTNQPPVSQTQVLSSELVTSHAEGILRLDQVDFPPGAIAWRHTHPGAGIRYLTRGNLLIESDHTTEHMRAGEAWFEAADSPVKATAGVHEPAAFVRFMLLPVAFEGKPTLNTLDPDDAAKPRLQTNTRHFDQRVNVDSLI